MFKPANNMQQLKNLEKRGQKWKIAYEKLFQISFNQPQKAI